MSLRTPVRLSVVRVVLLVLLVLCAPLQAREKCPRPDPRVLPDAAANELLLVTQNLWRLVDDHPDTHADQPVDTAYYQQRLDAVADYLGDTLQWPHLLAVQEVEHPRLLEQLVARIAAQGGPTYQFAIREGLDPSGIDVALLYRAPVRVADVESPFHRDRYKRSPLYSRPPLVVTLAEPLSMTLVVVHLRSGINLEDARKGKNVQEKRRRQAQRLRDWLEKRVAAGDDVALVGDLNSAFGDMPYAEPVAILDRAPFDSVWEHLPEAERFSYVYQCRRQAIDNILLSESLLDDVSRVAVMRGNAGYQHLLYRKQAPHLVSDHDGLGVYLRWGSETEQ